MLKRAVAEREQRELSHVRDVASVGALLVQAGVSSERLRVGVLVQGL
jgi:hypothetical protein